MVLPPSYLSEIIITGRGVSKNYTDRAVEREGATSDDKWINAIAFLDDYGEKAPLMNLLSSDCAISATARGFLADLIFRGIARPSGRPPNPEYISNSYAERTAERTAMPEDKWVNAIARLDYQGKKAPLIDLLKTDHVIPAAVRCFLADLFLRGIAKPTGRPRTPEYRISDVEAVLFVANEHVSECIAERGFRLEQALDDALANWDSTRLITRQTLCDYRAGRLGHANRRRRARTTRP